MAYKKEVITRRENNACENECVGFGGSRPGKVYASLYSSPLKGLLLLIGERKREGRALYFSWFGGGGEEYSLTLFLLVTTLVFSCFGTSG